MPESETPQLRKSRRRGAQNRKPTADETYTRIVDAAIELIERQGFRGTSLNDIADAVGIQKASLYYHIGSKSDLLEAVYEDVMNDLVVRSLETDDPALPAFERLWQIVRNHARFHVKHRPFMRIFWRERHELPVKVQKRVREHEKRYDALVHSLLEDAQATGEMDATLDVDLSRNFMLGLLTTVYRWPHPVLEVDGDEDDYIEELARQIWRIFADGLGFQAEQG